MLNRLMLIVIVCSFSLSISWATELTPAKDVGLNWTANRIEFSLIAKQDLPFPDATDEQKAEFYNGIRGIVADMHYDPAIFSVPRIKSYFNDALDAPRYVSGYELEPGIFRFTIQTEAGDYLFPYASSGTAWSDFHLSLSFAQISLQHDAHTPDPVTNPVVHFYNVKVADENFNLNTTGLTLGDITFTPLENAADLDWALYD